MSSMYHRRTKSIKQAQPVEVMRAIQSLRKSLIDASRSASITADTVEAMLYDKIEGSNAFMSDPNIVNDTVLKRAVAEIETIRAAVNKAVEASDRVKQLVRSNESPQTGKNVMTRKSLRERRKAAARRLGLL